MSMDWESHRILTPSGQFRALVFTFSSGRVVMRTPLGYYAARDVTFDSLAQLESEIRKRRWRLKKAKHFS